MTDPALEDETDMLHRSIDEHLAKLATAEHVISILEKQLAEVIASREAPHYDLKDTVAYCEMGDRLAACRVESKRLCKTLDDLVEQIEIDGSLIHGDRCSCDICEAISAARSALISAAALSAKPEPK